MRRGVALAAALVLPALCGAAQPARWTVDHDSGRLGFEAGWAGDPFTGTFRRFEASTRFDPERPAAVRIDVTGAGTRDRDRERVCRSAMPWRWTSA